MKLSLNRVFDRWWQNQGKHRPVAWTVAILWLLWIGWLAFFWNLGSTGLVDETEPLFAEAARQMTVTGDWVTPFFNGDTRFDKPPLSYWLMAIAYSAIGVNEWAVRLPSALAAMGLVSLGFYTLWAFGMKDVQATARLKLLCTGLGAALMALNPETILWARIGVSDMLLTGCMGGALLSFFLGYAQPSKPAVQARWYLAFYVLVALAVLAKGPIGIILPVLIVGLFLLYLGNVLTVWREMRVLWGSLLVLAIALPWYILVIQANGWDYINSFFGYHNLERFTSTVNHHAGPWYYHFPVVLIGFAPWSVYLPLAIARLRFWQWRYWRSVPRSNQLGLFALFWFGGVLGFFTIATTKLPSYVLPLMPAAAILVTLMWTSIIACRGWGLGVRSQESGNNSEFRILSPVLQAGLPPEGTGVSEALASLRASPVRANSEFNLSFLFWSSWLNVALLLVLAIAVWFSPYLVGKDQAIPNLQQLIQQSGLPVIGGVIWAIAALAGAMFLWRRQWWQLLSVNLLGFLAFLIFVLSPAYFLIDDARQLPLRELSAIARTVQQPGEELVMVGFRRPSVVFYTQSPVTYIRPTKEATSYVQEKLATKTTPPFSVLLLILQEKFETTAELASSHHQDLGKAGAYQLTRVMQI